MHLPIFSHSAQVGSVEYIEEFWKRLRLLPHFKVTTTHYAVLLRAYVDSQVCAYVCAHDVFVRRVQVPASIASI